MILIFKIFFNIYMDSHSQLTAVIQGVESFKGNKISAHNFQFFLYLSLQCMFAAKNIITVHFGIYEKVQKIARKRNLLITGKHITLFHIFSPNITITTSLLCSISITSLQENISHISEHNICSISIP